jgi:catechol 2,3-dioxygenase-like lactoylglutathione lyase family enzyme
VTFAVSDLEQSIGFYTDVLGLELVARWTRGAYLLAGGDWICLSLDLEMPVPPKAGYTHMAFTVDEADMAAYLQRIKVNGVRIWRQNQSEGDSLYLLDPDGHQLELHVGSLQTRLEAVAAHPYDGWVCYRR